MEILSCNPAGGSSSPTLKWQLSLAVTAGLLLTVGLPPYPWTGLLVPLGLALLFSQLMSGTRPALIAWVFALAHQSSLLYWLFFLDPAKSIPSRALVPVQAILVILYVSLFYLALGWVCGRLRQIWGKGRTWLLLPVLWTAMEALRSRGEMGFPWCLSGSAVIGTPLLGLARASGEIGLGAGLAAVGALLGLLLDRRAPKKPGTGLLVFLAAAAGLLWCGILIGAGQKPKPAGAPVTVAAVQADVALADKWNQALIDSTKVPYRYLTQQAANSGARLVVWAETAIPAYVRYEKDLLNWTRQVVRENSVFLFTGFPDAERQPDGKLRRYNSSGLFDPGGELLDRYAKHHLLPIGEAMPFTRWFPFLANVDVGQAEWAPGPSPHALDPGGEQDLPRISGLICFESIFSSMARKSVQAGSQCLVVITNDGWFGKTAGPRQHTWLARMRAAECGVPVIRCANNGISFICDATGRILDRLDLGRRGIVLAEISPGAGDTTYVRHGAWPLFWYLLVWGAAALALPGRMLGTDPGREGKL